MLRSYTLEETLDVVEKAKIIGNRGERHKNIQDGERMAEQDTNRPFKLRGNQARNIA